VFARGIRVVTKGKFDVNAFGLTVNTPVGCMEQLFTSPLYALVVKYGRVQLRIHATVSATTLIYFIIVITIISIVEIQLVFPQPSAG
jgi:hypothetical protein